MKQTIAESVLNPKRYSLSAEAKKRLRWMYVISYECEDNISRASKKLNISREWLTKIHSIYIKGEKNPRCLEPQSRAPLSCENRNCISKKTENHIVKIRKKYQSWGKEKITHILRRDHNISVSSSTVGRYLSKNNLVDIKIAKKNKRAWRKRRLTKGAITPRERHPRGLEDAGPGALIAKDMKLHAKQGFSSSSSQQGKRTKECFHYQHTMIDSCSRRRVVSIVKSADSQAARDAFVNAKERFPQKIAAITNDNGSENSGVFASYLQGQDILQYHSRAGTPTDNPRVERSHLSDDVEWYRFHPEARASFDTLTESAKKWEGVWNDERPHQALGYLTPKEYEDLWNQDRKKALDIQKKWNDYLAKQSIRLRASRKEKRQDKIQALNAHLKAKLGANFQPLKV